MTIGETIRKALKELSDGILDMISPKDFRLTDDKPKRAKGYTEEHTQQWLDSVKKPKKRKTIMKNLITKKMDQFFIDLLIGK